ncbi:porin family protein [Bacteroidota bacterium]
MSKLVFYDKSDFVQFVKSRATKNLNRNLSNTGCLIIDFFKLKRSLRFTLCSIHLIFIFTLFVFNYSIQAQSFVGGRAGLNLSKYVGKNIVDHDYKYDYHAGAYLIYYVDDQISVRFEINLSNRGSKRINVNDTIDKILFNLRFIDLPIMATQHIRGLSVSGGFVPSFLLKAENDIKGEKNDIEMYYNPFSIAISIGVQYDFNPGYNIGARVEYGLLDLYDENIVGNIRANQLNFQLYLGYSIQWKTKKI